MHGLYGFAYMQRGAVILTKSELLFLFVVRITNIDCMCACSDFFEEIVLKSLRYSNWSLRGLGLSAVKVASKEGSGSQSKLPRYQVL